MTNRWGVVSVLVLALTTYGCETANGGDLGMGGMGGMAGTGGTAGTGGMGGQGGAGGEGGMGGAGGEGGMGGAGGEGGMGGAGGMGGMGGMGGTVDLCMGVDCDDGDDCTVDTCNPADGMCEYTDEIDGTSCDFGGLPGICTAGVCEDAMLCSGVDCDDGNDCTVDLCDPADGMCGYTDEVDGTSCDFGGLPGVCAAGVCEDAMLCDAVDCDDGNDCTVDACDPADGSCGYTDEVNGTVCDAMGISGTCLDGTCIPDCTPTPDVMVVLPTTGSPIPTFTDVPNGFSISTAACAPPRNCTVTFNSQGGMGSSAYGTTSMDPLDAMSLQFFDLDSNSSTASNVLIHLSTQGSAATVDVRFDGGPAVQYMAIPGQPIDLSPTSAHEIEVSMTSGTGQIFWQALEYDHDCL